MAYKLQIIENPERDSRYTLGKLICLNALRNSPLFDVSYHTDRLKVIRGFHGSVIYFEGRKIFLDLWEYPTPTHTMEVYNANFDLIIELQHKPMTNAVYNQRCDKKKILPISEEYRNEFLKKIVPWSFFPSKMFEPFVGNEKSLHTNDKIKQDCFFYGRGWKCRHRMIKALRNQQVECLTGSKLHGTNKVVSDEMFFNQMKTSKYGLVLNGRASLFTDAKNRREIDYMMLKKPLLLSYKPYYYNSLIEGKHYIHINENTCIKSIESMYNIEEIANNGYQWYQDNATPSALAKVFLQIMQEKLNI